MKHIIYIFLLLAQFSHGQSTEATSYKVFKIANEMYKNADYENAIQKYDYIEKSLKQESADLYFNLGNCYFKLNKIAPSIYYYEKALLLKPEDKSIKTNLVFAKKRTIDDIKVIEPLGFLKLKNTLTSVFLVQTWTWLSVVFSVLSLFFFTLFIFNETPIIKRISFVSIFVALFFVIVCFLSANFLTNYIKNDKPAIIFDEFVEVKAEPKEDADKTFTLHEGTKVFVKETLDNYTRIKLTDNTEGWILSRSIKQVR
ncbi:tetratricopeptide repeat protein [uncultured Flavobacterium sp.]|uniref:tetratricopeptide repeat protein n=1 Tax=uncultured Flavobacterium sp. TaxID=165435 RepID=UPI0030CA1417|tara:strand:+ start:3363 stop:4130 length:768 start_codon:yes stop_codon:yes gene_type:complete